MCVCTVVDWAIYSVENQWSAANLGANNAAYGFELTDNRLRTYNASHQELVINCQQRKKSNKNIFSGKKLRSDLVKYFPFHFYYDVCV